MIDFWYQFRGPYLLIAPSTINSDSVRKIKTTENNVLLPKIRIFSGNYSTTVKKSSMSLENILIWKAMVGIKNTSNIEIHINT